MKMTKAEIVEKVKDLIKAPSCYAPLKELAEEWLKAQSTAEEKEMSRKLVAELKKRTCRPPRIPCISLNRRPVKRFSARKQRRRWRRISGN